jgi:NAD+ diphosphatase
VIPAPEPDALVFAFRDGRLLVAEPGYEPPLADALDGLGTAAGPIALGPLQGRACYVVGLADEATPAAGLRAVGLRELFARVEDPELIAMASRASQVLEWWVAHAFCGRCGGPTEMAAGELARTCGACGALHFPRISPAVITLVHRGREILLAHDHRFRTGFYALVAGFVEPGETLEQAVAREVREEVGVEVDDVRYFGSQAWPFPSQLMVGFFARYRSGEIAVQESELTDARWFDVDDLPASDSRPATFSIAGRLIERFLSDFGG